jgi:hypothetical protein
VDSNPFSQTDRVTVWIRPGTSDINNGQEAEKVVCIVYRFPFPPQGREVVSSVDTNYQRLKKSSVELSKGE